MDTPASLSSKRIGCIGCGKCVADGVCILTGKQVPGIFRDRGKKQ